MGEQMNYQHNCEQLYSYQVGDRTIKDC